jgi:hypothetical protein
MEIKFLIFIWLVLAMIGCCLMYLRTDVGKLISEANFIMTKGAFIHKTTYLIIAFLFLPITIPYSLRELLKRK